MKILVLNGPNINFLGIREKGIYGNQDYDTLVKMIEEKAQELGCNKIALGHHFDDAVETFLMSLLYEGRIGCFEPVTYLSRTGITQIRPMLYVGEQAIAHFAERYELPVVHNVCPADKHTKRQEVKELIVTLQAQYPDLKSKVFGAMQRLPLPKWGPEEK